MRNVLARSEKLLADEAKGIPMHVNRPLWAQYPDIEADVVKFIEFV